VGDRMRTLEVISFFSLHPMTNPKNNSVQWKECQPRRVMKNNIYGQPGILYILTHFLLPATL
jgi:hypothetical protein